MTPWHQLAAFAFLLAGLAPRWSAADDPCLNRTIAVNVTTEDGRLVKGLDVANFHGKLRGKPVEIITVTYNAGPRRVVILFDTSGSMGEPGGHWRSGLLLLNSLIDSAPPQVSFAFLTFSREINDRIEFSSSREVFVAALAKLEAKYPKGIWGKTALIDAALEGLATLGQTSEGDTMMLITDGGDNGSKSSENDMKRELVKYGARFFVFYRPGEAEARGRTVEEAAAPDTLRSLVEITGGDFFAYPPVPGPVPSLRLSEIEMRAEEPRILTVAARVFAKEMFEHYSIRIRLPGTVDKASDWKLEAVAPSINKSVHLRVLYPRKLAPCR